MVNEVLLYIDWHNRVVHVLTSGQRWLGKQDKLSIMHWWCPLHPPLVIVISNNLVTQWWLLLITRENKKNLPIISYWNLFVNQINFFGGSTSTLLPLSSSKGLYKNENQITYIVKCMCDYAYRQEQIQDLWVGIKIHWPYPLKRNKNLP